MNNTVLIYIWGQLDVIHYVLRALMVFLSMTTSASILFTFTGVATGDDSFPMRTMKTVNKILAGLFFINLFLVCFLPSQKTFAAMTVIPLIMESNAIQEDAPEIYEMAKEVLKSKLIEQKIEENK